MKYSIETKCVQEGYKPSNGEPRVLPLYQSTTYKYDSSEHLSKLFDLAENGHMYTRISNPTTEATEKKICELEGGVGAMITSSGQAAVLITILTLCKAGDHFITSSAIYGGTVTLMTSELDRMGIEVTFVLPNASDEDIEKEIRPTTRLIYGETVSNPALNVFDIERFAKLAHAHKLPLVIDNTFPTPYLCRPFEFGADIVIHSTSKYLDGHASSLGGVIVDSGKFDWSNGVFPEFTTPNESYHGIIFAQQFGNAAFITKARVLHMRDFGAAPSPFNSYLLNLGMETLHLRMEQHCRNAMKVASFLNDLCNSGKYISFVNYPGLESDSRHALAKKYLRTEDGRFIGASGVISYGIKGGRKAAQEYMDKLRLANIVVHVADARTSIIHPASTTHRQLTDEQLTDCGITPDLVRMSIGIENADDIIADIKQALGI